MHGCEGAGGPTGPQQQRKQARARRQRAALFVGSALLHLGFFLLAFSSASGDLVSAGGASGGPSGPVFSVTLVNAPGPATPSVEASEPLQALYARVRLTPAADGIPTPIGERPSEFSQLAERLSLQQPSKSSRADSAPDRAQGSPAPSANPLSRSRSSSAAASDTDGQTEGSPSAGGLWGRIEPCWRDLSSQGQVAVRLEVVLDSAGRLRAPPTILRQDAVKLDDVRLRSEERALQALAACMPKAPNQLGGRSYQLTFTPKTGR